MASQGVPRIRTSNSYLSQDTLLISGKSEKSYSSEARYSFYDEAGFGNLRFTRARELTSWRGELPHPAF